MIATLLESKAMETMISKIQLEDNMTGIADIINYGVFCHFADIYAKNIRRYDRKAQQQQDWINAVNTLYNSEIYQMRNELIAVIPARFHSTIMYNELIKQLKQLPME